MKRKPHRNPETGLRAAKVPEDKSPVERKGSRPKQNSSASARTPARTGPMGKGAAANSNPLLQVLPQISSRVAPTSVDTWTLMFPFEVIGQLPWPVEERGPRGQRGRLFCSQGRWVYGWMERHRVGNWVFHIKFLGIRAYLMVYGSVPKWRWSHNAAPVSGDDCACALQAICQLAEGLGLLIVPEEAKISRLDICRDVVLPRPYSDYSKVLRAVCPPRCKLFAEMEGWFLRGNKSNKLCFYDKYQQAQNGARWQRSEPKLALDYLLSKFKEHQAIGQAVGNDLIRAKPLAGHILRAEIRYLSAATVRRKLGFDSVQQLVANYDHLETVFNKELNSSVFRAQDPTSKVRQGAKPPAPSMASCLLPSNELERWHSNARHQKSALHTFALAGFDQAVEQIGAAQAYALLRVPHQASSAQASRDKKKLREWQMRSVDEGTPYAQLYRELQVALVEPVSTITYLKRAILPSENRQDADEAPVFAEQVKQQQVA